MISGNRLKFIKSLQIKKYRSRHRAFLVEGEKNLEALLHSSFEVQLLLCTETFRQRYQSLLHNRQTDPVVVSEEDLVRAGTFQSNEGGLAVVSYVEHEPVPPSLGTFVLLLNDIRDPGNLGTLLRIADWYGIEQIICSPDTVDVYNPKVVAASMGSFTRVCWHYEALEQYLSSLPAGFPVFVTAMDGELDVHHMPVQQGGAVVVGNEAQGVSTPLLQRADHRLRIPSYGTAESLNAAVSTAVVLDNIRRLQSAG